MTLYSPQYKANSDINVSTFVKVVADSKVDPCGANEVAVGVMHESAWATPIPGADGDVAVIAGQSKRVYGLGEVCLLKVTASPVTAGALLASAAGGLGAVATTGQNVNAIVLQGAAASGFALVLVVNRLAA